MRPGGPAQRLRLGTRLGHDRPDQPAAFLEAEGVEDWRVLGEGVCTYFRTGSFAAGARLVHAISELAGLDDHHPDVDMRYGGVTVQLITIADDYYGLSKRDVELARQIPAMARKPGWWTLADAEGNEVDVATALGRD